MFTSLKSMLKVPVVIKPFLSRDSANEVVFDSDINTLCLPEFKETFINKRHALNDTFSRAETSRITLYIDGTISISEEANIVFENKQYKIKGLSATYYNGERSLWMVQI